MSNQKNFTDLVYQITDKTSWFWGHIASTVLNHPVAWYGYDGKAQPKDQRNTVSLATVIGWLDSALHRIITGQAATLAAVKALGEKQGVDPVALQELIDKAVSEAADKHLSEAADKYLSDIGTYELKKVEESK